MWMPVPGEGWPGTRTLDEAQRQEGELARLCDLAEGKSVWDCGRSWCNYFDEEHHRCGLMIWNVSNRLGPAALRWFAEHRTSRPVYSEDIELALAARSASL